MMFSVTLIAAVASLVSAAPTPHNNPGSPQFALRLSAPGTKYDNWPLDVAGDIQGGVNVLTPAQSQEASENQFELVIYNSNNTGFLYYGGFEGDLDLYAGFNAGQQGIAPLLMVNSPGNPNPTNFMSTISFDGANMKIAGLDGFYMCQTQKADGSAIDALNWDSTGTATSQGCTKVSIIQGQ